MGVLFFWRDVWLQPDTVTAKHLILFSLCEDVLNVKGAVLNEDIIGIDREGGLELSNILKPVAILLLTVVCAIT